MPVPQEVPNSDPARQQSHDVAIISEGAAYSQCIAELTDWLGSAKIALQVTGAFFNSPSQMAAHPVTNVHSPAATNIYAYTVLNARAAHA